MVPIMNWPFRLEQGNDTVAFDGDAAVAKATPVQGPTLLIDLPFLREQPDDRLAVARAFGLRLLGLVELAPRLEPLRLQGEEAVLHRIGDLRGREGRRIGPLLRVDRERERARLLVEPVEEAAPVEGGRDPVVVRGAHQDDRPEELAGRRARQEVRPELGADPRLLVREEEDQPEQLGLDRRDRPEQIVDPERVGRGEVDAGQGRADRAGRIPACEVLINTAAVRDNIRDMTKSLDIPDLIKEGTVQYGMQSFDQSLFDLYEAQRITEDEALRNADSTAELRQMIHYQSRHARPAQDSGLQIDRR